LRLELAGGIHHVATRSNGRALIFEDDVDRGALLGCFVRVIRKRGWLSLAYCVMGTHYHVLVETPEPDLADGMRDLNSSFARWWRDRRGSNGHVFGGRYVSKLVQHDAYLLQAARYVVRNPVEAKLCARVGEWAWSSFRATCAGSSSDYLHSDRLLRFFGTPPESACENYRAFVEDESVPAYDVRDNGLLGDHVFADRHIPVPLPSPAIPWRFSTPRRAPLSTILASAPREQAAVSAHLEHGYLLKEIAEELGVDATTIGRWVRRHACNRP
jgi:REP element-mobilizing transposase RayT